MIMKVGTARTEPNQDPYCPPPTGRLQFSWNPFYMSVLLLLSSVPPFDSLLGVCKSVVPHSASRSSVASSA
jgi:hypothetical protein